MESDEVQIDRRRQKRVSVEVGVTMTSDSNLFVGFTDNVSEGGLFVATHELLPIGSTIELEFQLPDGDEPITSRAEVRWHRNVSDPKNGILPGFGASFLDVSEEDQSRLQEFIDDREPMFHPE